MLTPTVFSYTLDPLQVLLPITLRSARCWGVNSAADERVVVLIGGLALPAHCDAVQYCGRSAGIDHPIQQRGRGWSSSHRVHVSPAHSQAQDKPYET
eukprot:3373928-Rhodomonas_salina.2